VSLDRPVDYVMPRFYGVASTVLQKSFLILSSCFKLSGFSTTGGITGYAANLGIEMNF